MWDKRVCRGVWCLAGLLIAALTVWRLSGCPGPPRDPDILLSPNFLPLLPSNVSSTPPPYLIDTLSPTDKNTLIDLPEFSFLTVSACNSTPLVIVIVHSAPANRYHRRMIRQTWGSAIDLVFLVGETNSSSLMSELDREIKDYGDIVQGTFIDSYRNLTYKHVMGLKWATYHCPGARYILKIDDDVFVNAPYLLDFLNVELSPLGARRLILCDVMKKTHARRSYRSKWRVSPVEYPGVMYPPYCSGWAVLYSPDVAFKLYTEAQRTPYFWIDDVHITGVLASRANFTHTPAGNLALVKEATDAMIYSGKPTDFLFSLTSPNNFKRLWFMINNSAL